MSTPQAPGWYGKLAMLGDFASRRLPHDDVQWLDEWLSACLQASRGQLGERWLEVYLSAPLWRFVLGPGVMGPSWWCGVMMASCDNVGRYFPLLVLQPSPQGPAERSALDHLDRWWAHVAQATQDTLAEGASLTAFEDALLAAPGWPQPVDAQRLLVPGNDINRPWRHSPVPQTTSADLLVTLSLGAAAKSLQGHSLWWALADDSAPGAVVSVPGLPPPPAFAQMLTGRW
jgi:type VI secretion system protein ImpM